jgi:hypothetical protein
MPTYLLEKSEVMRSLFDFFGVAIVIFGIDGAIVNKLV